MQVLRRISISSDLIKLTQPTQPFSHLSPSCLRAPPPSSPATESTVTPPSPPRETKAQTDGDSMDSWDLVDSTTDIRMLEQQEEMNTSPRERTFWQGGRNEADDEDLEWASYEKLLCGGENPRMRGIAAKLRDFFWDKSDGGKGLHVQMGMDGEGEGSRELLQAPTMETLETGVHSGLESCYVVTDDDVSEKTERGGRGSFSLEMKSRGGSMDGWVEVRSVSQRN